MKIFETIFTKIIWAIILLLLFGAGCVFILRNFLNPPPVPAVLPVASSSPLPPQPIPTQEQAAPFEPTSTPSPNPETTPNPETVPTPEASNQSADAVSKTSATPSPIATNPNSTALPALALPNQVALSAPKKMTPGAVLSIYENVDNNSRPDPINYSPTTTKKVDGLSLTTVKPSEFQQVSGYFLAQKLGNYSFVMTFGDNLYLDASNLRLKIDGQPLGNVKGGSLNLERGWHKVDLFYWESSGNGANQIQVKWGLEGSSLVRMQTYRPDP